ncbi:MAG: M3 family oligoendopeptidase [Anaerolineales bacterium]|nr:M3 family oligoendopeptidase [Anaerolineales bacterium]
MSAAQVTGAENVQWDLGDLYSGVDDPTLQQDLERVLEQAQQFAQNYKGRVEGLDASQLLTALQEYEAIKELSGRMASYASLSWTTDTLNPDYGRLMSLTQRRASEVTQLLVFFSLEWMKASEETAALADDPVLAHYQHYLKLTRLGAPYALGEKEEQLVSELSLTGMEAWERYFGEVLSAARYEFEGERLNQSEILRNVYHPDRTRRQGAADAFTAGLQTLAHTTTFVFNQMALNKHSIDKVRGFPTWVSERNLWNQTDDQTVETLIDSVTGRYDIVARYYTLVRQMLGYDTLYEYDRYAPVMQFEQSVMQWGDARELVLSSFNAFSPQMSGIAAQFFEKNWIDAALKPNKRGGAYSHSVVPSVHPYIFMNYTGEPRTVMTLAHELGHGVHQFLSRSRGYLQADSPLTTAEMASTFAEMLVFDAIMAQTDDPKQRLSMRMEKIADTFATVFRQISLNRFEHALHTTVRQEGELTTARISELWMTSQQAMFGDSLTLRDEYSLWWSYIPHFIGSPGYVYAYAFGELLVWALYARYQAEGGDFPQRYLDALATGGSVWPHDAVAPLGADLQDPAFWQGGLSLIEDMVALAEQEAEGLNFQMA